MPLRVSFRTLGCKLNQLETDSLADGFARAGWIVAASGEGPADLVVVNTCTVTGKAERKARREIRLALAENPEACALVTGCYAEVEAEELAALDPRAFVLRGSRKSALLGLPAAAAALAGRDGAALRDCLRAWLSALPEGAGTEGRFSFKPEALAFHSRPSLKIQDGCDNACSFCRVRIARGPSTSLGAAEILARARELEEAGRAEIVLTGVNISQYRDGEHDLPRLLALLLAGTERIAFRLSSYEPDRIDSAFLEAFAHPRVRPHLHLAVQSGADPILAAMGRRYGRAELLAAVRALRWAKGDPFIAADLICGFPGETEADAEASLDLARECDFAWIHAFRFSPRPGTLAASLPRRPPASRVAARAEALLGLGKAGRASYIDRWQGREVPAVLEASQGPLPDNATTHNYLKVRMLNLPAEARRGQAVQCLLETAGVAASGGEYDAFALYITPEPRLGP